METLTPEQFAARITDLGLADRRSVDQAMGDLGSNYSLDDMITVMQRRGVVTTLQTEKILTGERQG
ncbi:MAG: serine/threonine protein kinase, partial [Pirellulales bacterium]|nr:serine/threonine protein kinase [Pirellulales bacterium]